MQFLSKLDLRPEINLQQSWNAAAYSCSSSFQMRPTFRHLVLISLFLLLLCHFSVCGHHYPELWDWRERHRRRLERQSRWVRALGWPLSHDRCTLAAMLPCILSNHMEPYYKPKGLNHQAFFGGNFKNTPDKSRSQIPNLLLMRTLNLRHLRPGHLFSGSVRV